MNGKVKFFNQEKRFGFITGDDGKDYFVHISSVENEENLNENDEVEFEPGSNDRGPMAQNVKKVE